MKNIDSLSTIRFDVDKTCVYYRQLAPVSITTQYYPQKKRAITHEDSLSLLFQYTYGETLAKATRRVNLPQLKTHGRHLLQRDLQNQLDNSFHASDHP